jgi:hypothetical protein
MPDIHTNKMLPLTSENNWKLCVFAGRYFPQALKYLLNTLSPLPTSLIPSFLVHGLEAAELFQVAVWVLHSFLLH